ncbi:MAG: S8 family serine peptidase [Candidatus Paceibacterota bacterium]
MKKFKKISYVFSVTLTLAIVLGSFNLPVLAYEKDDINFEQTRTKVKSSSTTLNKVSTSVLPIAKKQTSGLEKSQQTEVERKDYVEGEILVKYKNNQINLQTISGRATALNFADSKSLEKTEDLIKSNISVLRIKDAKTVEQKIAELKNDPNVEYAEPNYIRPWASIIPNDTNFSSQWGLNNTTITTADVSAPEAWNITSGSNSVIVGILDSGIAYNHPDLKNNMWDGSIGCKDENNITISCPNHGWDFVTPDNDPNDDENHGTHVAGIIGAEGNNSKGISGVNWNVKLMALKVGDFRGAISGDVVKAIDFAINNNVKIINASFSGANSSQSEIDAINRFKTAGGIFIVAAGNESVNNENVHSYPSDYNLDNIISVAATDQNDALANFSNYSATYVDVGAPGVNILSTVAGTNLLNETFEGITPPAVPSGWVKGGTNNKWATYGFDFGNVLYGDLANPYDNNANTTVTSPTYNLSGNISGATIDFDTRCDTEYVITNDWYDYIALEVSNDGVNFTEQLRWDEALLDILNGDSSDIGGAFHSFEKIIPSQYLSSNFKFRFRWITDSSVNNFDGCRIDDIKITRYSDGSDEKYDYMNGTSMATPHVAGLAALLRGYNPSLTLMQVKNVILTTGDSLASLSGKTVSGKRINMQSALQSVNPAKAITAFDFTTPVATGVINETDHIISITIPSGTDVTLLTPTVVITGASVSPLSGVAQDFSSPVTYTVTAADSSTQAYVVTVNAVSPACQTVADTSGDGNINNAEILSYIGQWKVGNVLNPLILQAINFWKAGVGC